MGVINYPWHYNLVNYDIYTQHCTDWKQNIDESLNSQKTPHVSPSMMSYWKEQYTSLGNVSCIIIQWGAIIIYKVFLRTVLRTGPQNRHHMACSWRQGTIYPKKYAHGFCFAVLCCGYTLTDFPISIRLTSLALWQSYDCPSASKATLMNMDKYFMWIHYERLHNHNKAKHNKTVCIFLGIYCMHGMHVFYEYKFWFMFCFTYCSIVTCNIMLYWTML